jgi:hypothetical protein
MILWYISFFLSCSDERERKWNAKGSWLRNALLCYMPQKDMGIQNNTFQLTETWIITTKPMLCHFIPLSLSENFTMTSNSGFRRCVKKNSFALPWCYVTLIGSHLPTFRENVSCFIFMGAWKIGPIIFPETSVNISKRSITCQNGEDINSEINLFLTKPGIDYSLISIPTEHIL